MVINMKKLLIILLVAVNLVACSPKDELNQYKETTFNAGFDTIFTLIGYTRTQEEFDEYFQLMQSMTYEYHKLFDKYHDYEGLNNIKTINDQAGIAPVYVDQKIVDLLLMAKEYYDITDGYFDITLGAVLKQWHDCRKQAEINGFGCVPSEESLQQARQHTGWELIQIDTTDNTVYITDPKASIDVGGIAKGYTVEMVALALEQAGLSYGAIDGGGNIRTINSKPNNEAFTVGITDPDNRGGASVDILKFELTYSFVTSGDYERYYLDEYGNRYHHIIDPFTLYPSVSARSVTIIYPNSAVADILSTACYIMDYDTAMQFIKELNDDDLSVIWLYNDNDHPDVIDGKTINNYFEIIYGNVITENK